MDEYYNLILYFIKYHRKNMKQNILVAEQRTGHHIVFSVQKPLPNKKEWTHEIFHSQYCVPILP